MRVSNTRHPETGLFKIPLSVDELRGLTAKEIVELARTPRRNLPKANGVFSAVAELVPLYQEALTRVRGGRSAGHDAPSSNEEVIAVLERRYVPDLRHRLVLALAGFAAKSDVPKARCLRIVELLVERAKDGEAEDRARAVEDSYEAVAEGRPAKGYRDLVQILGEEHAAKLDKLLGKRWRRPAAAVKNEQAAPAAFSQIDLVPWIRERRADLAAKLDVVEKSLRSLEADRQAILEEAFVTRRGLVEAKPSVGADRAFTEEPPALARPRRRLRANNDESELGDQPTLFGFPREAHKSAEDPSPGVEVGPALAIPFRVIRSLPEARRALENLAQRSANGERVGFDLETIGLDPLAGEVRLSQYAPLEGEVLIIDHAEAGPLAGYADLLRDLRMVVFNGTFEGAWLSLAGANAASASPPLPMADDAFLENQTLECTVEPLNEVVWRCLGIELDKSFQARPWTGELSEAQCRYAAADALTTLRVHETLTRRLDEVGARRAYELQRDAIPAVVWMRMHGAPFDLEAHREFTAAKRSEAIELTGALRRALGGKDPSPLTLASWLEPRLPKGFGWPRTPSGRVAVDEATRATVALRLPSDLRSVVAAFSRWQTVDSILKTFGDKLASHVVAGRIHADFKLGGAASGRLTCSRPNLQQLPRDPRARRCVRAPEGYRLVVCDYGQIELRILALFAREERMLRAFREGADIHVITAAGITGKRLEDVTAEERQRAKAANFGLAYGQSAAGFAETSAANYGLVLALEDAERLRASWFAAYPNVAQWQVRQLREAKQTGTVRTVSGRVRDLGKLRKNGNRGDGPGRIPLNFPVQGAGAEGLLSALRKLPAALADLDAAPVITVHDEIVLEAREDEAEEAARRLEEVMREGMLEVLPELAERGLAEARVVRDWSEK
jgi:DNA polymerase I-like protein with 3'-5' exonuclease and polymerase domains